MKRIFIFATAIAVLLAMGMGSMGAVVAEENATANESVVEDELEATDDYHQAIDTETRITDWSYTSGRFTLTIEADETTRVSLTEAGTFEEGTSSFNYDEVRLEEGENTITFAVADRDGAAVAVATRQSLSQGTGAIVSTGMVEQNPFRHFGGESGLFSGVIMTVSLAGLGSWYVVRSEDSGVIEA
ncbi:hypothetical protein [Natronosalvus vescus]|uniref:hypothetical protein n=1 Tax=Natronosalvus vescus TaxID=2953881 RepID=UPI0020900FDD|nr:hypothetical protein [Natronosalvus vescus]